MSFNGNEQHDINLTDAAVLTRNFRDNDGGTSILAHYFGKTFLTKVLEQEGCVGIRIYYGLDVDNNKELIIVGVDSQGHDLYNGVIGDRSFKCPPICSGLNELNS